jgi:signal transduction histidine kinase/CheY-like chemotaxis protein
MQLREQPSVLDQLSADLRDRTQIEADTIFAARQRLGILIYLIIAVIGWSGTSYRHDHFVVLLTFTVLFALGLTVRLFVVSAHDKIRAKSVELWYRLAAFSVFILATSFGFLLAHAMATYGLESWNFIVILIWNTGVVSGSVVSLAPSSKIFKILLSGLLLPPLACALSLHSSPALQYAFANLMFLLFTLMQGKQVSADFWKQLAGKFLEEQRKREIDAARHVAENALVAAEEARRKAEHAAKARSEFLANMSHEIRTPMNAVMGMTTLILDQELPSETLDYVNTIRSSSDALLTIINDILDFSKIESGKLDLENEPFCLHDCVEEALELLANRAAEKNLELVAQIDPRVSEWVFGDITRTRQILLNLVGNAVKFTMHGEVVLSAGIGNKEDGSKTLHVAVRDTGIGIPPEKIGSLFQSFTQVDSSTTRRFGGSGLGLAISKRLTELMGGRVWVTSELGVGSIFQLELPYQPAHAEKPASPTANDWLGKRIMVVDDNETSRLTLTSYLNRWKFSSHAVASAKEALQSLRAEHADAVLLDGHMPEMNGTELALAIAQEFGSAAPPMIMLLSSGAASAKVAFGDRVSPLAAILSKPIRRQQLRRTIGQVLSGLENLQIAASARTLDSDFARRVPLHILLAEDNAVNQKVAVRMLERLGYRPDFVGNGLEVLEALGRQHYDVVLMDVQMPEMNGLDATRQIISTWGQSRPWITALTAGAMKENRDECLTAGVDDFLTKPINVQELQRALERCFQHRTIAVEPYRSILEPTTVVS